MGVWKCYECGNHLNGVVCFDCGLILQFSKEDGIVKRYPCYQCVSYIFSVNYFNSKTRLLYHHKSIHCQKPTVFRTYCYKCDIYSQ